jgi:uncharacterized protein (DUF427 family)
MVAGRIVADSRDAVTLREASYAPSISIGGTRSINAVWTYEEPHPAVAEIQGHLAFTPSAWVPSKSG